MNFRRAVLFSDQGKDPALALSILKRVAPALESLLIVVPQASLRDATREAANGAAAIVEVELAPRLGDAVFAALCAAEEIDLVVFATRSLRSASLIAAQRLSVAVLWADGVSNDAPITRLGCVALDERSRTALARFLRDHSDPSMHVSLLSPSPIAPDVLEAAVEVSGIKTHVETSSPREGESLRAWVEDRSQHHPVDLLVFARVPSALVLGAFSKTPVLFVLAPASTRPLAERAIDAADVVDAGGPLRARIDQVAALGSFAPVADQAFWFVSQGRVVATLTTKDGEIELPAGTRADSFGIARVVQGSDPLAAIEHRVSVVRPAGPLVLIDAELADARLAPLATAPHVLAVRLRPTRSCGAIRERLRAHGISARVVDARAVLDEGSALDVSDVLDAVRLNRVAEALRRGGFTIAEVIPRLPMAPTPAVSAPTSGNHIELELDNRRARAWLLETIASAKRTLHLQVYMAEDDHVGSLVEAALVEAAGRGVKVRVLVDSLHGFHGSFGAKNPLLDRLSVHAGIELRTLRPINEMPSLVDLKQRDHRKLVVADGAVALMGGRNLSDEYYTGFEEAALTTASQWRDVPWLDAGARIRGPAAASVQRSFLNAWMAAGGASFPIEVPPAVAAAKAQVIEHHGLREARTLETYRALIDTARSHVYIVNGFPLVLELQHALLRALRNGVSVRALIGHVTPTHDGQTFAGPWATARTFATELVHSRMDPIVEAGGEVFLFALRDLPLWEPGLGLVHPHVHAKALSVDGRRCAVGSANMDITASYWESELLLLVDDESLTRGFDTDIEARIAGSTKVQREDPLWQQLAKRRAWMRHWPGILSV